MPWVTINMLEGRPASVKEKLHAEVNKVVSDALGLPPSDVRVQLVEMPRDNFSIGGKPKK
jgi:4-oxalocrotonate tautomerase